MEINEQATMFLQSLRGVQPTIMLAFLLLRRAMTVEDIQVFTSLSDDAIRPAMNAMAAKGWFVKQTGERGKAIWVPNGDTFFGRLFTQYNRIQNPLPADSGTSVVVDDESKSFFPTITTITTTNKTQNPLPADSGNFRSSEEWTALCGVLKEYMIIGKKREQLIACEWVTADYVRAHVEFAQNERIWDQPIGMAITRMLEQLDAPENIATKQNDNASKYDGGSFKDLIVKNNDKENHGDDCTCASCRLDYPERFCQFKIVHEAIRATRTSYHHAWSSPCGKLLRPGQTFCDEHESEKI